MQLKVPAHYEKAVSTGIPETKIAINNDDPIVGRRSH
jgi:hypothetical protein